MFVIFVVIELMKSKICQNIPRQFITNRNAHIVITVLFQRIMWKFISIECTKLNMVVIWITFVLIVVKVSYSSFHWLLMFTGILWAYFHQYLTLTLEFRDLWLRKHIAIIIIVKTNYLVWCIVYFQMKSHTSICLGSFSCSTSVRSQMLTIRSSSNKLQ